MEERTWKTKGQTKSLCLCYGISSWFLKRKSQVYCCQFWMWVDKGYWMTLTIRESEGRQDIKTAGNREMLPRKKGLEKQGNGRSAEALSQQYFWADKILAKTKKKIKE